MAAPIEITVDAKGMPLPPVDPNVVVPARVKAASLAADAAHQAAYNQAQPQPQPAPQTAPQPAPQTAPQPQPVVTAPVTPAAPAPEPLVDTPEARMTWDASQWMQHAKSMEGRFKQTKEQLVATQSQMTELGEELVRSQTLSRTFNQQPQPQSQPQPPVQRQVTPQDVETYGEDFLNVAQRAAIDAVAPQLAQLNQRNQQLERQLRKQTIQTIEQVLDQAVPSWPQINLSPKFKAWLRLRDIYSGRVRQELLNDAHQAADAARVLVFFKGFLAEEEATGSTEFLPVNEPSPQATPHIPAIELQALAAPGHARPAAGTTQAPANEPIWITRGQISKFYENARKGVYAGREQDYHNDQAIIFECQRAGRVR